MKPRSLFINASRGMVVDDVALRENIESGHIAGAALDVFPVEPKAQGDPFESVLRGLDNVILTPHVGGSTQEAQEEIGWFVAGKLGGVRRRGQHRAVGEPAGRPAAAARPTASGWRYLHVNVPGVLAEVNAYLAEQGANVTGQYLATRGEQGYVVTDATEAISDAALDKLRSSPQTIWLRSTRPDSSRAAVVGVEAVKQPLQRQRRPLELRLAHRRGPATLDVGDPLARGGHQRPAPRGEVDQLGPAVDRVRPPFQVAERDQVVHQLEAAARLSEARNASSVSRTPPARMVPKICRCGSRTSPKPAAAPRLGQVLAKQPLQPAQQLTDREPLRTS